MRVLGVGELAMISIAVPRASSASKNTGVFLAGLDWSIGLYRGWWKSRKSPRLFVIRLL